MGSNKLEKQIREKLEAREIQPSAQSWDRLNAMLSIQEEKKTRRILPWLSVAASFLVLSGLGYHIVNQNKQKIIEIKDQPSVVEMHQESAEMELKEEKRNSEKLPKAVAAISKPEVEGSEEKFISVKKTHHKENQKVAALGAASSRIISVVEPEKESVAIKQEVDAEYLLAQVEKNKTELKSKVKVDPKDLLTQVDGEIELTFRQKVMRTIKKNYQETKVAISTRNQESSSNH